MSKETAKQAQEDEKNKQSALSAQWKGIASQYPNAHKDLIDFLDNLRDMYINYGEERSMPGPDGKKYTIDDHTIAALLQGARVCGIVKTYINNRVDVEPKN